MEKIVCGEDLGINTKVSLPWEKPTQVATNSSNAQQYWKPWKRGLPFIYSSHVSLES